jgi:predicted metal-binding membrane protein
MAEAGMAGSPPLAGQQISLLERGGRALLISLLLVTLGAWAVTLYQARTMEMPMGIALRGAAVPADSSGKSDDMPGMDMTPSGVAAVTSAGMSGMNMAGWTWGGFATFLVVWAVMMAAMMFPAVAPLLLMHRSMVTRGGAGSVATWAFATGYLLVWVLVGAATWALVQVGVELGSRLGSAERETVAPIALGATLVVAGVYQFTPIKRSCLRQCQSPVGFLMTRWRPGYRGAVRMGLIHGLYCLGCCWALFAVLVAAGVMSVAWMLLLTAIVFAEKVLHPGAWGQRMIGASFAALGLLVTAGAVDMPWRM